MFGDDDFWYMFLPVHEGLTRHFKLGDFYGNAEMKIGGANTSHVQPLMESLSAFWPGVQVLLGELTSATRTLNALFTVREDLGFIPERFWVNALSQNWGLTSADTRAGLHPLRPELYESAYLLHRVFMSATHSDGNTRPAAKSSGWLWAADFALQTLENLTKAPCGYATVQAVGFDVELKFEDEMPSYFLSETIKYFYLMFDDSNVLHRSSTEGDGQEWIFTTEAHPVHFVPRSYSSNSTGKEPPTSQGDYSISIGRKNQDSSATSKVGSTGRVSRLVSVVRDIFDKATFDTIAHHLAEGTMSEIKWTKMSNEDVFRRQLNAVKDKVSMIQGERKETDEDNLEDNDLFTPLHITDSPLVSKRCKNIHHPRYGWMHALNLYGGLDYEEGFVPTNENYPPSPINQAADDMCLVIKDESGSGRDANVADHIPVPPIHNTALLTQRVEMQGLGTFDLAIDNDGIMAQHLQSGETLEVVIVSSDAADKEQVEKFVFVVATSTLPQGELLKRAVISDFKSNAFHCEVLLKKTYKEDNERYREGKQIIAQYPCSCASFGPTRLRALRRTRGIEVEAKIFPPRWAEEKGCYKPDTRPAENESKGNNNPPTPGIIQMVLRGECPFQQKAINQKVRHDAKAVVVVNTNPNQLFMMSAEDDSYDEVTPLTVLIDKEDGRDAIRKLRERDIIGEQDFDIICTVRVRPQIHEKGRGEWPLVATSPSAMQMFASKDWGLHVVAQNPSTIGKDETHHDDQNWQVFIIKPMEHDDVLAPDLVRT